MEHQSNHSEGESSSGDSILESAAREAWVAALRLLPVEITPPVLLSEGFPSKIIYPQRPGKAWQLTAHSPEAADQKLVELLQVLTEFHSRGLFHGDLLPEKIRDTPTGICLVEPVPPGFHQSLGISDEDLRRKLRFGPPEMAVSARVTPAADIYRVGMIWYGLRTGRDPFLEADPVLEGRHHLSRPLPPDEAFPVNLGAERLLRAMTARNPDDRLPDAMAVLAVLAGAPLQKLPQMPKWQDAGLERVEAEPPGPGERTLYVVFILLVVFSILVLVL